jgi:hypothetical protein
MHAYVPLYIPSEGYGETTSSFVGVESRESKEKALALVGLELMTLDQGYNHS